MLGIDVGTTELKYQLVDPRGTAHLVHRQASPDLLAVAAPTALVSSIGDTAVSALGRAAEYIADNDAVVIVSVVAHSPTLCAWSTIDDATCVPYMVGYGDPKANDRSSRVQKTAFRSNLFRELAGYGQPPLYLTGLTGYVVARLCGSVTLDAFTGWEMGFEAQIDADGLRSSFPEFSIPYPRAALDVVGASPVDRRFKILAGATDSTVLPLAFDLNPEYIGYVGTWGSVLQSGIRGRDDYTRQYLGEIPINKWLIAIPGLARRPDRDQGLLEYVAAVKSVVPAGHRLGLIGGLMADSASRELLCNELAHYDLVEAVSHSPAFAASCLGFLWSSAEASE